MLKLNAISRDIFFAEDLDKSAEQSKVRLNSGSTNKEMSRKDIVALGRLVACEYFGKALNASGRPEKYESRIKAYGGSDYFALERNHREAKLVFCAAFADRMSGKDVICSSFEDFKRNSAVYANDAAFFRALNSIDQEVLEPIFFDVLSDAGMSLMDWEPVAMGSTKIITVPSNDVFLWEDLSHGSLRNTTKNYAYAKEVALTPKPYGCNFTIKWYQDIVNGDTGRYYAAAIAGLYSKIYAIHINYLNNAISSGYIPSGLTAATYNTANWIAITDLVAAANGVRVTDLMAVGTRSVLNNVLPVDSTGGAIAGLQFGLGAEWFRNGYMFNAAGVDLFPVTPAIVPGTQNTTLDTIDTGNNIYILAKAGYGYKPMVGVYAEGMPLILSANPLGATGSAQGTADMTIDVNLLAYFDIKPVFPNKVGVITNAQ